MTETVETTTDELTPFTEGDREIAYRAEGAPRPPLWASAPR